MIDETSPTLAVIPAGQTFYFGNEAADISAERIQRIRVWIRVGSTPLHRYALPLVSDVRIDRANQQITAVMTNPYDRAVSNYDLYPYLVVYDRSGKVIGGSSLGEVGDIGGPNDLIRPGGRAPISFAPFPDGVSPARVASARITVQYGLG